MDDQALEGDLSVFGDIAIEEQSTFEEPITIKRWVSVPATPGVYGTPQKATFTSFAATAVVVEMGVASKYFAVGVLSVGDLVIQIRDRLNESNENIGGAQGADRVIYRGMEYRLVQRPIPIAFGDGLSPDVPFYLVHLRRTNATTDTVGG